MSDQPDLDTEISEKSKTKIKQHMRELTELGRELAKLKAPQLALIPLTDELRTALEESHKIGHHSARKRHFQFIGKLLRKTDSEAIVQAYQHLADQRSNDARRLQAVEQWRDQLLSGDSAPFSAFIAQFPDADRQQLRALIRSAAKEAQHNKAPTSARKLFKLIRDTLSMDDNNAKL